MNKNIWLVEKLWRNKLCQGDTYSGKGVGMVLRDDVYLSVPNLFPNRALARRWKRFLENATKYYSFRVSKFQRS
jgi:hypothetical protein